MGHYAWVLHDSSGATISRTRSFESKDEAEAWMGQEWSKLLEEGAEEVSLVDEQGTSFYKMGLREE